ncbi:HAMP domain-containing sensor histidine kinase [Mastigocoleus sp. MO_188.B34]|uniref:sensor histidine kinase n=1 Tax=Mastigocoleus sp. MO_188.B34 TaxID=3036635 RepID=UPI00262F7985|nr:HAMP domain-containing sensor histidine kinase [Mastigocoleus sp. MO_188.B34]MDJ0695238.1 HAMP domain-containing sensor histidine kinase [Mastigocoleus sp. MO_188.B34]
MCWNNWIYLLIGLIFGLGISKLIQNLNNQKTSQDHNLSNSKDLLAKSTINNADEYNELAYQMAQEMSEFKGGFLARVTHELRSPLNGLIGLHQLILEDLCESPSEEREFISQAHERALILLKLLDEILKVARADYGANKLDIQPVSISKLFQEVYELNYMLAANRNFPFIVTSPQPEIYASADKSWLRQVLNNLVSNTIAHMEEGKIYLSAAKSNNSSMIHVWLDVPNHALLDREPIELISSVKQQSQVTNISELKVMTINENDGRTSPGMKLLLNQNLLETMNGKLEVISLPENHQEVDTSTRIQISIPRANSGVEPLEAESEN